jgi:hypothetical protein
MFIVLSGDPQNDVRILLMKDAAPFGFPNTHISPGQATKSPTISRHISPTSMARKPPPRS